MGNAGIYIMGSAGNAGNMGSAGNDGNVGRDPHIMNFLIGACTKKNNAGIIGAKFPKQGGAHSAHAQCTNSMRLADFASSYSSTQPTVILMATL